jgi:hypothetical protein
MSCDSINASSEWASGLLQHSRVTTFVQVLAGDIATSKLNSSLQQGDHDALLTIAAHSMTELSSMNYSSFSELGLIGALCVLISLVVIAICTTLLLSGNFQPISKVPTTTATTTISPAPTSSNLDLRLSVSKAPILVSPDDGKGLFITARKSRRRQTPLTPGIDIVDAAGLHLLHFMPSLGNSEASLKGACCSLHVGAGGPLLATVEVGGGKAIIQDSNGITRGRLEAVGAEGYALDGLGSCRAFVRGAFKERSLVVSANGGLLASTEVPPSLPDSTRPAEPDVAVCVAPSVDAGLVLCAALAVDWLEAALQGRRPAAPWGCAFPEYFRHRLNLVAEEQS